MNNSELKRLQDWYQSQVNDEWEHEYGISIENLDNPGWYLKVDLAKTDLQSKHFQTVEVDINDNDWYICKIEKNEFHGYASTQHLVTLLKLFNDWAHES